MSDIVDKLRSTYWYWMSYTSRHELKRLHRKAADEIIRLREENKKLQKSQDYVNKINQYLEDTNDDYLRRILQQIVGEQ